MTISNDQKARPSDAVWSRVERDFYVGSRNGNFIGHIERLANGRYEAHDPSARGIASFTDLLEAIAVLEAADARRSGETGS
jgi:hypothetical protein